MTGPHLLMYHSVDDDSLDPYSVSLSAFSDQVSWLSDNGYEIVSLAFLVQSLRARELSALHKKVVLTFDDGYADFVANALPVLLLRRWVPATVFLVTAMLGETSLWNKEVPSGPLMSEAEARHIRAQGISLGSHTGTHANLAVLEPDAVRRQLLDSRERLADLGETFFSFSYPWGQWSEEVVGAVKAAGYECAVAVGGEPRWKSADPYLLPRLGMTRDLDLKRFRSIMTRSPAERRLRKGCGAVVRGLFGSFARTAA